MRIAGVRLDDGRMVWVDALSRVMAVLDRAVVQIEGETSTGVIYVTPEQMLQPPGRVEGTVQEVVGRPQPDPDCRYLPGADLPALGLQVETIEGSGMVVALDPVRAVVTLRAADGTEQEMPLSALDPIL